jgi:glycosyltransferase involved in cell wall biosynthesis
MKIAIIRSTLHKGSGQAVHIGELARRLRKMGHVISVFSREVEDKSDLDVYKVNFFFDDVPFIRHVGFGVKAGVMARNFDIIHSQYHPGIFAGNVGRFLRGHHVFTFHGFAPIGFWKNPTQKLKMIDHNVGTLMALRLGVDHVITVSRYLKNTLLHRYGFARHKVTVVYNGVDLDRFNPEIDGGEIREEYGFGDAPIVLFIGRIAPYKGPQFLALAASRILDEVPDAKFIIAGSGRYDVPRLKLLVGKLGVEDAFTFTGYVPDDSIPSLYASCDIFCYPSLWEGFGLTPAEAQACGKPVVAFNHCAIPEVVGDRETGILVPPKNHIKLAEAIIELLLDKGKRLRMGGEGRKRVENNFSWDNMAVRTLDIYERVLGYRG